MHPMGLQDHAIAAPGPSPSDVVANRELLDKFRSRLTPRELQIVDLRQAGRTWPEVAAAVGGQADVERIKHTRLVTRFLQDMGLEENDSADDPPPSPKRPRD
jgi:hypothetical protein